MKKTIAILSIVAFTAVIFVISLPSKSEAMPVFARQIAKNCTYCHTAFPKLNETGRIFRSNGYRFPEDAGEGVWKDVKSWTTVPFSAEVEVEAAYNSITTINSTGTVREKETDLIIEEVEILTAASMGPNGEVSVHGVVAVVPDGKGGNEVEKHGWIQLNDLVGETGAGLVNFKVGGWAYTLPFLGPDQQVIHNSYFADDALEIFGGHGATAAELNGSIVAEEDSSSPTIRYSLGISKEHMHVMGTDMMTMLEADSDPMRGYYGTLAFTFQEKINVGFIYRHTEEAYEYELNTSAKRVDNEKLGAAVEVGFKKGSFALAYFKADGKNHTDSLGVVTAEPDLNNIMAEVFFFPTKKLILGARYDILEDTLAQGLLPDDTRNGKPGSADDAEYLTVTARYNIIPNVYAQFEWRDFEDNDAILGGENEAEKGRLFLVALY